MGVDSYDCELRLALPGTKDLENEAESEIKTNKRLLGNVFQKPRSTDYSSSRENAPVAKAQIVGWPPIRSYRKNSLQNKKFGDADSGATYVKVSMDGAPYLRKIDLNVYNGYSELLIALDKMFRITIGNYTEREGYKGSEYAPTYEDKDGDWMLLGDVPWEMFINGCRKLRIMKGSDATGFGCPV